MDHHHKNNEEQQPLYANDPLLDDESTLNRAYAAAATFFAILGEWLILLIACSIALFFFPLTPSFTINSASSSVINVAGENHLTANFDVGLVVDDSTPVGSTIYYDSLHLSLFHRQEMLSSFSLRGSFHRNEPSKTAIVAKFPNVSVNVDEWGVENGVVEAHHGTSSSSCGYVYLDLWLSASVRYTQKMWPPMWDKLQGHCGEVKVELCSSSSSGTSAATVVVQPFLASCDVYSDLVCKVRLFLFVMIFILVTALAVPLLFEHFFCSSTFSNS